MVRKRDLNSQCGIAGEKFVAQVLNHNGSKGRFSMAFTDKTNDHKIDLFVYDNMTQRESGIAIRSTKLFKHNGKKQKLQMGRVIIPIQEYAQFKIECEDKNLDPIYVAVVEYDKHKFILCRGFYTQQLDAFLGKNKSINLTIKRIYQYGHILMDIMKGHVQDAKMPIKGVTIT